MTDQTDPLNVDMLRTQIAALDETMQEALARRTRLVGHLAPLIGDGANNLATVIMDGLGEEVLSEGTHVQSGWSNAFALATQAAGLAKVMVSHSEPLRIWDSARAIFGHDVPMLHDSDPREVLSAVVEQHDTVGVLGWMPSAGSGQWWPILNESRYHTLRIIGAWPVADQEGPFSAVVANGPLSVKTGRKTIFIAHDDQHKVGRIFSEFDLTVKEFGRARSLVLFEVDERMADDDARIKGARMGGLDGLRIVGALPAYQDG